MMSEKEFVDRIEEIRKYKPNEIKQRFNELLNLGNSDINKSLELMSGLMTLITWIPDEFEQKKYLKYIYDYLEEWLI